MPEHWGIHVVSFRAEYKDKGTEPDPECEFVKMRKVLQEVGIKIIHQTVQSVPPYEGQLFVDKKDVEKAIQILNEKGIKWKPQSLVYPTKILHPT